MIGHKDGKLYRIEVKSTETESKSGSGWEVQIKKVRPNKTENKITNFSKDQCDLLAIYLKPVDKVLLIPSADVKTTCQMTVYKWMF